MMKINQTNNFYFYSYKNFVYNKAFTSGYNHSM